MDSASGFSSGVLDSRRVREVASGRVSWQRVAGIGARFWLVARRQPLCVALPLCVAIVEFLATAAGAPPPSIAVLRHPFACIAAATIYARFLIHEVDTRTRCWIVYLTPTTLLLAWLEHRQGIPAPLLGLNLLFALGVFGVLGFALAAWRSSTRDERNRHLRALAQALVLPLAGSMVPFGLWSTYSVNPVYDARIYAFEEILGVRFSLLGVASYRVLFPLSAIATVCYSFLPFGLALVAAKQRSFAREGDVLLATIAAGTIGFFLYFVCPVVGPLQAFAPPYPHALPPAPPGVPLLTAMTGVPRNGMPSLHTAWALIIWWNARPLPAVWRQVARLFAALTIWAAMGLDDTHWFTDIVVGVPLAVAIQSACVTARVDASRTTWTRMLACAASTAAWLAAFRLGRPLLDAPPLLAWLAVAVSVAWPLASQRSAALRSER